MRKLLAKDPAKESARTLPPFAPTPAAGASTAVLHPVADPKKGADVEVPAKEADVAPVVDVEEKLEETDAAASRELAIFTPGVAAPSRAEASPLPSMEFGELHRLLGDAHEVTNRVTLA